MFLGGAITRRNQHVRRKARNRADRVRRLKRSTDGQPFLRTLKPLFQGDSEDGSPHVGFGHRQAQDS